jgi:hypothetical protein
MNPEQAGGIRCSFLAFLNHAQDLRLLGSAQFRFPAWHLAALAGGR